MEVAQDVDTRNKQLARFQRLRPHKTTEKKPFTRFVFKGKPKAKSIQNVEVDDCDVEDEEDYEEEEEHSIDTEIDLCVAGTTTGVCFNCGETGHFSHECKKPKKTPPSTMPKKKPFFNQNKKAGEIAKTIQNLDTETRDQLLELFNQEGF